MDANPTSQPLIGTYLACNTRFVISDIRSHPAKPQGSANDASLKLLADFSRGIATRIARNATQLDRFRDRHTVAGAKDDSRDAYVLADSLRTDQHCFRRIEAQHPDVVRLRELSRTEESLGADFRRAVNQLYQLLLRYYPQLLRLNSTPDEPWIWALLELAPAPQRGARLTLARLRQLLAKHRIRRWSAEEVREVLQTPALPLAAGTAEAVSEHVLDRAAKANKSSCDVAAVRGFEMRCIIGRAAAFNTTHPPNFTMLACARPGTITDGRCVVLPTACLPC
jgi:Transposase